MLVQLVWVVMVWREYSGLGLWILFLERVCIWWMLVAGGVGGFEWFGLEEMLGEVGEVIMDMYWELSCKELTEDGLEDWQSMLFLASSYVVTVIEVKFGKRTFYWGAEDGVMGWCGRGRGKGVGDRTDGACSGIGTCSEEKVGCGHLVWDWIWWWTLKCEAVKNQEVRESWDIRGTGKDGFLKNDMSWNKIFFEYIA